MADQNDYGATGYNFFINNCMGSFFRGTLNWWADVFYPRVNYRVIGTYEKSVEYFQKKKTQGREIDTNILPSMTLDPAYEFQPAEVGGRFFWQYPLLSSGLGKKLFNRIKILEETQSVSLVPVFTKYEGAFDIIFWLHSVYELFDVRVFLLQYCGGYNRPIRPTTFDSLITVPPEIVNYTYQDVDGNTHNIDWTGTGLAATLIDNTANFHYTLPTKLTPFYKLTSLSDASEKYGGDNICKYKLTATFEFEVDLPTYMVLTPYCGGIEPNVTINMGATYSRYGLRPTLNPVTEEYEEGGGLPPVDRGNNYDDQDVVEITDFEVRYVYVFTEEDEDNYDPTVNPWFSFPSPFTENLTWGNAILITYLGELPQGEEWKMSEDETKIEILVEPLHGEIVEVFVYSAD